MHDREFEKQVQQKMQELRFQPGADVWARVQADIRKKRRRRPVLVWMLLAGLMIGGAWILYSNYGNDKQPQAATPVKDENISTKEHSTPAETTRDVTRKVNPEHQQATEKPAGRAKDDRQPVETVTATKDRPAVVDQVKKNNVPAGLVKTDKPKTDRPNPDVKGDVVKRDAGKKDANKTDVVNADVRKTDAVKTDVVKTDADKSDADKTDITKVDKVKSDAIKPDATRTNIEKTDVAKTDASKTDVSKSDVSKADQSKTEAQTTKEQTTKDQTAKSSEPTGNTEQSLTNKKKTPANANNKWQWGISTGAGVSNLAMKLFQNTSTLVADYAFNSNFGGGVVQGPGASNARRPSEVTTGGAFNVGGYVSKSIANRLRLKLGLGYEYYSNNIKTGAFVDSTRSINRGASMNLVDEYYRAGTNNTYTNKYHYISLPLSVQWRLNKHPKYGVVWENGVTLARLIQSNALHFDGISGSYYADNSLLQKTQVLFGSALLFDLKMKNNRQLYVGPHVQYGLTNVVKYENNSRHMRYAGVKLMLGFNKN